MEFPIIGDQQVSDGNGPCPFSSDPRSNGPVSARPPPVPLSQAGGTVPGLPLSAMPGLTSADATVRPRPARIPVDLGHIPFVIRRDGVWLYRGSPIERKEMVCLFASILRRDADGAWWLRTPAERGCIVVEDAPFIAVELDWTGEGREQTLSFRTNVDHIVTAGPTHPLRVETDPVTAEPIPYILVRPGDGTAPIEARLNRAVYYELVALAETEVVDGRELLGVWSRGCFFPLGDLPPEEE